ncbi:MAG: hypothetical protein HUJ54_10090 [Erysipelotrichaceae bacterium]|nr:hypothetical protein [Erysipelotrichaceae bacterium]
MIRIIQKTAAAAAAFILMILVTAAPLLAAEISFSPSLESSSETRPNSKASDKVIYYECDETGIPKWNVGMCKKLADPAAVQAGRYYILQTILKPSSNNCKTAGIPIQNSTYKLVYIEEIGSSMNWSSLTTETTAQITETASNETYSVPVKGLRLYEVPCIEYGASIR